jgi:hypothetical protein
VLFELEVLEELFNVFGVFVDDPDVCGSDEGV